MYIRRRIRSLIIKKSIKRKVFFLYSFFLFSLHSLFSYLFFNYEVKVEALAFWCWSPKRSTINSIAAIVESNKGKALEEHDKRLEEHVRITCRIRNIGRINSRGMKISDPSWIPYYLHCKLLLPFKKLVGGGTGILIKELVQLQMESYHSPETTLGWKDQVIGMGIEEITLYLCQEWNLQLFMEKTQ